MRECKHYDAELDCCKKLGDWSDPMPVIHPCTKSPCELYEPSSDSHREEQYNRANRECTILTFALLRASKELSETEVYKKSGTGGGSIFNKLYSEARQQYCAADSGDKE